MVFCKGEPKMETFFKVFYTFVYLVLLGLVEFGMYFGIRYGIKELRWSNFTIAACAVAMLFLSLGFGTIFVMLLKKTWGPWEESLIIPG